MVSTIVLTSFNIGPHCLNILEDVPLLGSSLFSSSSNLLAKLRYVLRVFLSCINHPSSVYQLTNNILVQSVSLTLGGLYLISSVIYVKV